MYLCSKCKEKFIKDEVVFLNGDDTVLSEEDGGSGDIDNILCTSCYYGE